MTPSNLPERLAALDTAEVSDALDSLGVPGKIPQVVSRVPGSRFCGPAFTVRYQAIADPVGGFRNAANYIDEVPEGAVIVSDNAGSLECTTWGSLLTITAGLRKVAGSIVFGSVRDLAETRELGFPLFSAGVSMVSGKNRVELAAVGERLDLAGLPVAPGDYVLADDNGALVVPAELLAEVVERAERVRLTEERIAEAVRAGMSLAQARSSFGYAQPWAAESA
ncbi:RraA family protein [Psychromicrobium lacuslunae]|uniref:Putative 4-hydroxy-4-methyl-2-oxoglutarate aldolase n=1 Tax=Psychromicrobium lacuslunae TaxID=1618207 RepID=A0A0D4BZ57_9MICC|nr:hypothetical protein [Psychromicrobium lacuslunae]AJT41722.1 hypothetical protein UM93_09725 [Psychromicrobium lacuslunae]